MKGIMKKQLAIAAAAIGIGAALYGAVPAPMAHADVCDYYKQFPPATGSYQACESLSPDLQQQSVNESKQSEQPTR